MKDALNRSSRGEVNDSPKARFRTKDISIHKMYRNDMNFYSVEKIEELAGDILLYGLSQNLELTYAPCEKGDYRIIAGERRWEALKYLVQKGYSEFEFATCKLTAPQDNDEEQVEIIIANAYRTKTTTDIIEEEMRLKESLERMRAAGKKIKGYDLQSGRLRGVIASMLHISKTKVAQIESVNNNLLDKWKAHLTKGAITFSAAYELSGMDKDAQRYILESFEKTGKLTHKEVKDLKASSEEKGTQSKTSVSDSDTDKNADKKSKDTRPDDDYQDPHPAAITSICYTCTEYEECNAKTGICVACDKYRNRKEAYKTDEQRYSDEQDRIDRQTQKKLKEQADEENIKRIQSEAAKDKTNVHQIRTSKMDFDDIANGIKTFELQKNNCGYKKGDILEMMEFAEGKNTGRILKARVTYMLEDYTGIEDGYCIMAIKPIKDGEA